MKYGSRSPKGLPPNVEFCRSCIISNQKPITQLEVEHSCSSLKKTVRFVDGKCDACRWASIKETGIDWTERERLLRDLCDQYRSDDGNFDVVVPASGGKDSRFVAHLLKHKYGMHPLTVTWKPHIYTNVGFANLQSMISNGFPNILVSPDGEVQRKLCKLAFENIGHPFQPFIVGQRVVGPKIALQHNIKLVFYGENVAEYGNRIEDNFVPTMDPALYTSFDFDRDSLSKRKLAGIPLESLVEDHGIPLHSLREYQSPSMAEVQESGIEVHYMSYYHKWVPQDNYYYAVEHTGFTPNPKRRDGSFSRYAGLDDMMEDLHYYMQLIKFGMGRCTWDAAQEVRSGRLEREEAAMLVRRYDAEPPTEFLQDILDYLRMTKEEFELVIDSFRTPHLWDYNKEQGFHLRFLP